MGCQPGTAQDLHLEAIWNPNYQKPGGGGGFFFEVNFFSMDLHLHYVCLFFLRSLVWLFLKALCAYKNECKCFNTQHDVMDTATGANSSPWLS